MNECNNEPPKRLRICLKSPEETVEMVRSVSHERVQQRAAEEIEDLPQISGRDRRDGEVGLT